MLVNQGSSHLQTSGPHCEKLFIFYWMLPTFESRFCSPLNCLYLSVFQRLHASLHILASSFSSTGSFNYAGMSIALDIMYLIQSYNCRHVVWALPYMYICGRTPFAPLTVSPRLRRFFAVTEIALRGCSLRHTVCKRAF